jgi:hypothetical protein
MLTFSSRIKDNILLFNNFISILQKYYSKLDQTIGYLNDS